MLNIGQFPRNIIIPNNEIVANIIANNLQDESKKIPQNDIAVNIKPNIDKIQIIAAIKVAEEDDMEGNNQDFASFQEPVLISLFWRNKVIRAPPCPRPCRTKDKKIITLIDGSDISEYYYKNYI